MKCFKCGFETNDTQDQFCENCVTSTTPIIAQIPVVTEMTVTILFPAMKLPVFARIAEQKPNTLILA